MDHWQKLKASAERNRRLCRLRSQGWSYGKLAQEFGVSRARAHQIVMRSKMQ